MKHTTEYTKQLLLLTSFLNGLCFYAPVALLVRTQNGISVSQFFILQMILSVSIFLTEIPAGFLSDKIGYKRTLVLSQTFLLIARVLLLLSKNFWLFAAEAVIEALSISLSSGTESAYIYTTCKDDDFALLSSRISQAGMVGFLISTVSYSIILSLWGISGLVAATCLTTLLSLLSTLLLPTEESHAPAESTISTQNLLPAGSWRFFGLLSAISISYLVFNFFCAVKVERIGFPYESLTFIYLGYSAIELLAPAVIRSMKRRAQAIPAFLLLLSAGFFGLYRLDNSISVLFMLLIPLILSIINTLGSEMINETIDRCGLEDKRATVLSVFNIGNSLLEIAFLAGSAVLTDSDGNIAFLFVCLYSAVVFLFFLPKLKSSN